MTKTEVLYLILILVLSGLCITMSGVLYFHQCPLPTATEIQTRLVEEGYDITIDGRLGRETTKALDDYHAQKTKD
jgi:hypothetical protein